MTDVGDPKKQLRKQTKYIYSSTVLTYNFELLVLHYFVFPLRNTSTALHF